MTSILKFQSPAQAEREHIWAIAESWLGTPFVWQASVKGEGCDCKGLISGIAREAELPEAESIYALMADYKSVKVPLLRQGLQETFNRTKIPKCGDIALIEFGGNAQHLAICNGDGLIIHCYNRLRSVVIKQPIRHWKIDSYWTWKSINGD